MTGRRRARRRVAWVACDITTADGRAAALAASPTPDILVTNAGGPPPGDFRDFDRAAWIRALDANMLTPIELIKATIDGMIGRRFGRIVNITSAAVKAPIDVLGLSNGARAHRALETVGVEVARQQVVDRDVVPRHLARDPRDEARQTAARAKAAGKSLSDVVAAAREGVPAGRIGTPAEFGATCAFLCSVHAGYIVGQNVLIDGGAYPGTF